MSHAWGTRDMGLKPSHIRAGAWCGHNVPHQGLEFECAFAILAHLEELCGAAMWELAHREGLRTGIVGGRHARHGRL